MKIENVSRSPCEFSVYGIALVYKDDTFLDEKGKNVEVLAVEDENGVMIPAYKLLPPHIRELDQTYFRSRVQYLLERPTVVVIGSNTWDEMEGSKSRALIEDKAKMVIVSGPHSLSFHEKNKSVEIELGFLSLKESLERLKVSAYTEAIRKSCDILVLGGRSVYNAFSCFYHEFDLLTYHSEKENREPSYSRIDRTKAKFLECGLPLVLQSTNLKVGNYQLKRYKKC